MAIETRLNSYICLYWYPSILTLSVTLSIPLGYSKNNFLSKKRKTRYGRKVIQHATVGTDPAAGFM